jgi:hypothetical protein
VYQTTRLLHPCLKAEDAAGIKLLKTTSSMNWNKFVSKTHQSFLRIQFTQNLCCDDDDVHNLFERFPGSIPLEHGGGSRAYTTSSTVAKGIIIHHNSKSCSNYL